MIGGDLKHGEIFAGHRIGRRIGAGAWGVVYQALDPELRRDVAVKMMSVDLHVDDGYIEKFRHECQLLAQIDHPNVLPVYRAGVEDDRPYLVTRLVRDGSLRGLLTEGARLAPRHALHLLSQVAAALDAVHQRGIVHRDIKPENILIEGAPGEEHVWLADFGLAQPADVAPRGVVVAAAGTSVYMAPEQQRGGSGAEARTDVYALGLVLFEALTGRLPSREERDPLRLPPDSGALFNHLYAVLRKALARRPEDRYASAGELIEAGRAALGATEPPRWSATTDPSRSDTRVPSMHRLATPPAPPARPRLWRRARRRIVALVAGLAAFAGVAGAGYAYAKTQPARPPAAAGPSATPSPTAAPITRPPATSPPGRVPAPLDAPLEKSPSKSPSPTPSKKRTATVPQPVYYLVCGETVSLRAEPRKENETTQIGTMYKGDRFEVLDRPDSVWVYGRAPDGKLGWALQQWVKLRC
jgi:serine/threonine-protein kinase